MTKKKSSDDEKKGGDEISFEGLQITGGQNMVGKNEIAGNVEQHNYEGDGAIPAETFFDEIDNMISKLAIPKEPTARPFPTADAATNVQADENLQTDSLDENTNTESEVDTFESPQFDQPAELFGALREQAIADEPDPAEVETLLQRLTKGVKHYGPIVAGAAKKFTKAALSATIKTNPVVAGVLAILD